MALQEPPSLGKLWKVGTSSTGVGTSADSSSAAAAPAMFHDGVLALFRSIQGKRVIDKDGQVKVARRQSVVYTMISDF